MSYKNELLNKNKAYIEEIQQKQWRFPYEKVKRGSKIILYGAGCAGKDLYQQAVRDNYCIVVKWVDKKLKYSKYFNRVISPVEDLEAEKYDQILIAISDNNVVQSVRDMLEELHIDSKKIVDMF